MYFRSNFPWCKIVLGYVFFIMPVWCHGPSCCSLSIQELQALRHFGAECTLNQFGEVRLNGNKCMACPLGMCQSDWSCICPQKFLTSWSQQQLCKWSYNTNWPNSVGMNNLDFRTCNKTLNRPSSTSKSCCALTKYQLNEFRGWFDGCPSRHQKNFYFRRQLQKCGSCTFGTCRLNGRCVCPDYFLANKNSHQACAVNFGISWPKSITENDREEIRCKKTNNTKAEEQQDLVETIIENETITTENTQSPVIEPPNSKKDESSKLQIVQCVLGIIAGLLTLLGIVGGWICSRKKSVNRNVGQPPETHLEVEQSHPTEKDDHKMQSTVDI